MELPTYDEILTSLLNEFDNKLSPETIERTDGNIIYKLAQAISKTFERTNTILQATSTPFNPLTCTDEQLQELEIITQIKRIEGRATGLEVTLTNTQEDTSSITLEEGYYFYQSGDTYFRHQVTNPITLAKGESTTLLFISYNSDEQDASLLLGSYPVTEQSSITLTYKDNTWTKGELDTNLTNSNSDNYGLLGRGEETDTEYRQRLINFTNKNNQIEYIQEEINSLPYVFDCQLMFNNSNSSISIGDYSVDPYKLIVFIEGEVREEIANIIYENTLYLTQKATDEATSYFFSIPSLTTGGITIYINPFLTNYYNIQIKYKVLNSLVNTTNIQETITQAIKKEMNRRRHRDYITEDEIYNLAKSLNIENIIILNVDLIIDGTEQKYIEVPKSTIMLINSITYEVV